MTDQDHADKIDDLKNQINRAIVEASQDGLEVIADLLHRSIISGHEAVPFVTLKTFRPIYPKEN